METVVSIKPLLAVLVSLLVTPILVSSRTPNVREVWTFVAAGVKFLRMDEEYVVFAIGSGSYKFEAPYK